VLTKAKLLQSIGPFTLNNRHTQGQNAQLVCEKVSSTSEGGKACGSWQDHFKILPENVTGTWNEHMPVDEGKTTPVHRASHFRKRSPALGRGARPVVAGKTGMSGREAMWEFNSSLIP